MIYLGHVGGFSRQLFVQSLTFVAVVDFPVRARLPGSQCFTFLVKNMMINPRAILTGQEVSISEGYRSSIVHSFPNLHESQIWGFS